MRPRVPHVELIDASTVAMLRCKTAAEKIAMVLDANRTARLLLAAQLRRMHPDWTAAHIDDEVADRMPRGSS